MVNEYFCRIKVSGGDGDQGRYTPTEIIEEVMDYIPRSTSLTDVKVVGGHAYFKLPDGTYPDIGIFLEDGDCEVLYTKPCINVYGDVNKGFQDYANQYTEPNLGNLSKILQQAEYVMNYEFIFEYRL